MTHWPPRSGTAVAWSPSARWPSSDCTTSCAAIGGDLTTLLAGSAGQILTTLPGAADSRAAAFAVVSLPIARFPSPVDYSATGLAPASYQPATLNGASASPAGA